jgi:hypothetical protein
MSNPAFIEHEPEKVGETYMKEPLQLIRWGIPGTVFFGVIFFLNVLVQIPPLSAPPLFHYIKAHGFFEGHALIGVAAFLIGASIPVGFIIYQLYYFWFWYGQPTTRRRPDKLWDEEFAKKLFNHYRRIWHLNTIIEEEIRSLQRRGPLRRWRAKVRRNQYEWAVLSLIIKEPSRVHSSVQDLVLLDDIFHGLGASCAAMFLGSIIFVMLWFMPSNQTARYIEPDRKLLIDSPSIPDSALALDVDTSANGDTLLPFADSNSAIASVIAKNGILVLFVNLLFWRVFRSNRGSVIRNILLTIQRSIMSLDMRKLPIELRKEIKRLQTNM